MRYAHIAVQIHAIAPDDHWLDYRWEGESHRALITWTTLETLREIPALVPGVVFWLGGLRLQVVDEIPSLDSFVVARYGVRSRLYFAAYRLRRANVRLMRWLYQRGWIEPIRENARASWRDVRWKRGRL